MAISFIGQSFTSANGGLNVLTVPGGVQAGDLMIVAGIPRSGTWGDGGELVDDWNMVSIGNASETGITSPMVAWKICPSSVPSTITVGNASNNSYACMAVYRCGAGEQFFVGPSLWGAPATVSTIVTGTITTPVAGLAIVVPTSNSGNNGEIVTYTAGSYTARSNNATNNRMSTAILEYSVPVGATNLPDIAMSRSEPALYVAFVIWAAPSLGLWTLGSVSATYENVNHHAAVVDGKVYLVGGDSISNFAHWMYDPDLHTFTQKQSCPVGISSSSSVCSHNGLVYAFRGSTVGLQAYNPATNSWSTKTSPPFTTTTSWIVSDGNDTLFAFGGNGAGGNTPGMKYSVSGNSWTNPAALNSVILNLSGKRAILGPDGMIYSMGGLDTGVSLPQTNVQRLNPVTNAVTSMAALPTGRYLGSIAVQGDTIHYIGGIRDSGNGFSAEETATHLAYDTITNTWSYKPPMLIGVYAAAYASISNFIYVFGGASSNDTLESWVQIWEDPEINGGILGAVGRAITSLYAEGRVDIVGRAVADIVSAEVEFDNTVQSDSFLDMGSTGTGYTFDALAPAEDLAPSTSLAPGGDF